MKKGIDISKWQGNVDFSKVKKEVDFIILREGYRKQIDPKFLEYVKGCKNNDIPVAGVYHFCYATSESGAVEEAKSCIANIEKASLDKGDIIVFFDFEYDTVKQAKEKGVTLEKKQCISFTRAFCDYVESQGYTAGVYSNLDYYKNMYDKETISKYVYWLADYAGEPDVSCIYHQYTSSGKISGISGNVDMNYYYGEEQEEDMGVTAQDVLEVMEGWVGKSRAKGTHKDIIDLYNSRKPLARGYKVTYNDAYCDTTVSAVFIKLGAVDLIGGTECGVQNHINIFKAKGIWNEDGTIIPDPGDIVCFNWDDGTQPNDGYADHIGFVYSVNKAKRTMTFIEGNMSGGIVGYRYNIPIGWGYIRGYAQPKYAAKSSGSSTSTTTTKKSVTTIAREVIAGHWGNSDARKNALKSAGYDYDAVQKKVNEILSESTQTTSKSNTEIAREVIAGEWGNGDDRKKKLTAAGYNYTEIQKEVNKLLSSSGSGKKSITEVAKEVIAGKWGNGSERKRRLIRAGYDYNAVQKKVNQLL